VLRKLLCLLLSLLLLFPALTGLCEDEQALDYLYSFIPGTVLEGEGQEMIRELLDALEILFTRQKTGDTDLIRFDLLSDGEEAFSLTAGETGREEFSLVCSLLGKNKLTLRREQMSSFLQTLVEALGEQGILKGENLSKMRDLANKAGEVIGDYLDKEPEEAPDTGINIKPYLEVLTKNATATEQYAIPPEEQDGSGAVTRTSYLISEEYRRAFVNRMMDKVIKLPVIGDQFRDGTLKIGEQVITDEFVRSVFGDTPGEVTMDVWTDSDGQLVRLLLHTPDISGIVTDPQFSKTEGFEMSIARTRGEGKRLTSITRFRLTGLEGDLLNMTLERKPGKDIPRPKVDKVHAVGEMNSTELAELLRSMGWTILANAGNMILTLPNCVAETLIKKIWK